MPRWSLLDELVRRVKVRWPVVSLLLLGLILGGLSALSTMPPHQAQAADRPDKEKPDEGRNGMVVTVSPPGTDVGLAILKDGGNAVDAAVATALTLAVTYPAAGNIGGGGFMLVYPGGKE